MRSHLINVDIIFVAMYGKIRRAEKMEGTTLMQINISILYKRIS